MDPNDAPHHPTLTPTGESDVDARQGHRRLNYLLDLRQRLAVLAAEQRAHRLPDAEDTFGQQLAVENTLEREFPTVFARRWPDWVQLDTDLDHDSRALVAGCSICQAIAAHVGVNLTPPAAA